MNPQPSALLTDLYQLTMLQSYVEHGMEQTAVFEFFVRRLPLNRGFLMAAGLAQMLDYLESLHFEPSCFLTNRIRVQYTHTKRVEHCANAIERGVRGHGKERLLDSSHSETSSSGAMGSYHSH